MRVHAPKYIILPTLHLVRNYDYFIFGSIHFAKLELMPSSELQQIIMIGSIKNVKFKIHSLTKLVAIYFTYGDTYEC